MPLRPSGHGGTPPAEPLLAGAACWALAGAAFALAIGLSAQWATYWLPPALRRALHRITGRPAGRLRRAVQELAVIIDRTHQVIGQARIRLAAGKPDSATRLTFQAPDVVIAAVRRRATDGR